MGTSVASAATQLMGIVSLLGKGGGLQPTYIGHFSGTPDGDISWGEWLLKSGAGR